MFLPLNDKQFEFWRLQRSGLPNMNIAHLFDISKQAVSKALLTMLEKTNDPTELADELFEKLRRLV